MVNNSLIFKIVIGASPFCILSIKEIIRIKKVHANEKESKSLFLQNFDIGSIKNKSALEKSSLIHNLNKGNANHTPNKLKSEEKEEDALDYFYGKAWGYTTDYEIDVSLQSGDLIFIKYDLDYFPLFKRILLQINRQLPYRKDYDEVGIILKKNNISYVHLQNIMNGKERLIRYSHLLQKYKPIIVSLRRILSADEEIKKELHEQIMKSVKQYEKTCSSLFLNVLHNTVQRIFTKQRRLDKKEMWCSTCEGFSCKGLNSTIEIHNLITMLFFRSFNLFFYLCSYMSNECLKQSTSQQLVLFPNLFPSNCGRRVLQKPDKVHLPMYEFPIHSLTLFPFIASDDALMKHYDISYRKPDPDLVKETQRYLSSLIENEYTLQDTFEYIEKRKHINYYKDYKNKIKEGDYVTKKKLQETEHQKNIWNFFLEKVCMYSGNICSKIKLKLINGYHVYEIYKNINLLPHITHYSTFSLFFCIHNLYKSVTPNIFLHDELYIPKFSNLFYVRNDESEKLQKYFYQFNRIPK